MYSDLFDPVDVKSWLYLRTNVRTRVLLQEKLLFWIMWYTVFDSQNERIVSFRDLLPLSFTNTEKETNNFRPLRLIVCKCINDSVLSSDFYDTKSPTTTENSDLWDNVNPKRRVEWNETLLLFFLTWRSRKVVCTFCYFILLVVVYLLSFHFV